MTHPFQPQVTVRIKTTDKRERLHGRTGTIEKPFPINKVYIFIEGEGRVIVDMDNLEVVPDAPKAEPATDDNYLSRSVNFRVDYDLPSLEAFEKAEAYALQLVKDKPNVSFDKSTGGPCWNAYITFIGFDEAETKEVALQFIRYVKRFKHYRLFAA